jgi:hypothetical protein
LAAKTGDPKTKSAKYSPGLGGRKFFKNKLAPQKPFAYIYRFLLIYEFFSDNEIKIPRSSHPLKATLSVHRFLSIKIKANP